MSATLKAAILALKGRIADAYTAISAKGGTLPATQDSANLPSAIDSIPSGGEPQPNDFNFVDCYGLQQSYSKAEIDEMEELPTPKQYDGLTFDGYSRTLSELKLLSCCTIGCYYHTTDGYSWVKVKIPTGGAKVNITCSGGSFIEWGDGDITTPVSQSNDHIYVNGGYYLIKTDITSIRMNDVAGTTKESIIEFYISTNLLTIDDQQFRNCSNLKVLCYPLNANSGTNYVYNAYGLQNTALETLVIPPAFQGTLWMAYYAMSGNVLLKYVVADGATALGNRVSYQATYNIISFSAKNAINTIDSVDTTILPCIKYAQFDNLQTYSHRVIGGGYRFKKIDLPSTLTTIGAALAQNIEELYVRAKNPPAMSLVAFALVYGGVIHIPSDAEYTDGDNITWTGVDAYEHATNWSTFAGKYIADL